jgi:acyl carrier protein
MNLLPLQEELLGELATVVGHDVGLDDELLVEGGLDSFGIMQIVTYLEERYSIRIPDENLATSSFTSARIISGWVLPLGRAQ